MADLKNKTIRDLTDGETLEIKYNAVVGIPKYSFIYDVCVLLNQAGFPVTPTDEYNQFVAQAVSDFQKNAMGTPPTGTLNDVTLGSLIIYANARVENNIVSEGGDEYGEADSNPNDSGGNPHYSSYFGEDNAKIFRKNRQDIKIVFGNKSITKTIHDAFIRSQSVEVDTSGNPIYEVYEFIARDVTESDEPNDTDKYIPGVSNITAPSDIQYDFSDYKK